MLANLKAVAEQNVFRKGTLAYYDTFAGLVPCKVLEIKDDCYGFHFGPYDALKIQVTADRGPYKKGEMLTAPAVRVPPKTMVKKNTYSTTIISSYKYVK